VVVDEIRNDPGWAAWLAERPRFRSSALTTLGSLPEGSLGRVYLEFMATRGLDPASIPTLPVTDDVSFVRAHLYETHDLWHVVAGFDTDVAGELGVQAFYAAQLEGALSRVLISGALLQALVKERREWSARLEAVARGWVLGKRARPLFGVRWEPLLETPLAEIRARFDLASP
jgi:ubiquinone biosynthesis protein Coq4